jgi:hypothetical protein
MKKGKLLILLLALVAVVAIVIVVCSVLLKPNDQPQTTESASETESQTTEETTEESSTEEQLEKHEAHEYFVLADDEAPVYDEISKIDGEFYAIDNENNLLAVKTERVDTRNLVHQTISVYDLSSGEIIFAKEVSYPENPQPDEEVELEVMLDYPIIRVSEKSYSENGYSEYDIEYYLARKGEPAIKITDKVEYSKTVYENGLICFVMGDESVWIDKNMNVVRRVDAIIPGLDPFEFNAEYMGYLYSWTDSALQILNRNGVCSGTYEIDHEGFINVHVLDSGDVLIQEIEPVDVYTECDFMLDGNKYTVKSYVMKYLDGAMEEIELNFIVDDLATAYGGATYSFPFELAEGHDNQAYIYSFANGHVSPYAQYVVLNNALEIEYVLKNDTHGIMYNSAEAVDTHRYVAYAPLANFYQAYLFDLDGNAIPISTSGNYTVTGKYIVTETAIFDHKLNKLFDFEGAGFELGCFGVDVYYNKVYMNKYNEVNGAVENYVFDKDTNQAVMMADGVKTALLESGIGDGYYVITDLEKNEYSFVNSEGTTVFVTYGRPQIVLGDGLLVAATEFEGEYVIYVVK